MQYTEQTNSGFSEINQSTIKLKIEISPDFLIINLNNSFKKMEDKPQKIKFERDKIFGIYLKTN